MMQLLIAALASLALPRPVPADPPPAQDEASFRAAAAWSQEHGGVALVVRKGGDVVFEDYAPGHGADKPFMLYSGCVGMWAVAAVVAEQEGLLDLDEKVGDTIESWHGMAGKQGVTIRQLLTMESGIAANDRRLRNAATMDRYQTALEARMVALPGEMFRFGPAALYVFGALLEKKLESRGEDALAFLKKDVLEPIGMEVYYWGRDRTKHPEVPSGAFLTAREWSKFGQLILDKGKVDGRQLVDADRLAQCFQPCKTNPAWGMGFWLHAALDNSVEDAPAVDQSETKTERREDRAAAIPRDVVFSSGFGFQRLYVIPSLDLVVVRQGLPGFEFSDVDFLRLVLGIDKPEAAAGGH